MKLNIKILLSILLSVLLILLCNNVFATDTQNYNELFEYEINNNEVTITRFQGFKTLEDAEKGEVQIPNSINGYPVVKIGEFAFGDTGVKKVTLPNTLKIIETSAFSECDCEFTSIDIPASVIKIEDTVFPRCYDLKSINVDKNNKNYCSIDGVLYTKNKDTLVTYPIGKEDKSYSIVNGVKNIEARAFQDSNLENIIIPNSVTAIGYGTFARNYNLTKIELPNSIKTIGGYAFYDDNSLTEVITKANPNSLGENIFSIFTEVSDTDVNKKLTLTILKNSSLEKYAKNNGIKYILINEDSTNNEIINLSNNSIKIDTTTDVIPENTKLLVEQVTNGKSYNVVSKSVEKDVSKFVLYDISLESNNVKIQPNGKVKISIPVPKEYNKNMITVYRVEDNGSKIEYTTKIENVNNQDYVVFETDHFSNYVVAEKKAVVGTTETPEENKEHKLDNEPKTGIISNVSIFSIITVIAIVGIALYAIRKYTNN